MSQSLAKTYIHLVFSTKMRKSLIDLGIESALFAYIGGIIIKSREESIKIGGMSDHIHILCTLPKTISLSKYVQQIKANSSKRIKTQGEKYIGFSRQSGYACFSVSQSQIPIVKKYIENQKEHHKKETFKDELIVFLEKYNVEYDEDYLRT